MKRFAIAGLLLVSPVSAMAQEKDAKTVAQEVLDKGSALFDMRDAATMIATYTDDAQLLWIDRDSSTRELKVSVKNRAQIESLYRDIFKDAKAQTTSKNTVEYARYVAPDLMVIYGTFQPNVNKEAKFSFVQVRVKQGEKWLMKSLELFVIEQK